MGQTEDCSGSDCGYNGPENDAETDTKLQLEFHLILDKSPLSHVCSSYLSNFVELYLYLMALMVVINHISASICVPVQSWELGWLRTTHCLSADLWGLISPSFSPSLLSLPSLHPFISFHVAVSCSTILSLYSFLMSTPALSTWVLWLYESVLCFWQGSRLHTEHRGMLWGNNTALCSWEVSETDHSLFIEAWLKPPEKRMYNSY